MAFERKDIRKIRDDIEAALRAVGEKHGFTVHLPGSIRFGADFFRLSMEGRVGGSGDAAADEWKRYAPAFGLKPEDFGKTIKTGGRQFKLVGIKPRGERYNVIGEGPGGGRYKLTASQCLEALGRTKEAQAQREREGLRHEIDPELQAARRGLV